LKNKEIVKAAEPRMRKHVERKDLREFSGGQEGSGAGRLTGSGAAAAAVILGWLWMTGGF
jgi:hypothetical protein